MNGEHSGMGRGRWGSAKSKAGNVQGKVKQRLEELQETLRGLALLLGQEGESHCTSFTSGCIVKGGVVGLHHPCACWAVAMATSGGEHGEVSLGPHMNLNLRISG
jgi:hypothetical protein